MRFSVLGSLLLVPNRGGVVADRAGRIGVGQISDWNDRCADCKGDRGVVE